MTCSVFASEEGNGKNAWNGWNDPFKMDKNFETDFDKLPLSGNLEGEGLAWPGYYWANNRGGIAQRWRSSNPQDFKYSSPNQSQILGLSKEQINKLSPAEKFDLYMGDYSYPTVSRVWGQTRRGADAWHGICHGVSPSSLNHSEPKTVTLYNPDGIEITFYSADIKALLAYYYAKVSDSKTVQVGKRCFVGARIPFLSSRSGCTDVNPGSLHIIMANRLGISKKGFIADMDRYKQVWNHPAIEFSSRVLRTANGDTRRSAYGTVKRVLVKSKVKYSATINPMENFVIGTTDAKYDSRIYTYWLELDSSNRIIGGEWVSDDRPDFLWYKEKAEFTGYWKGIEEIYQAQL